MLKSLILAGAVFATAALSPMDALAEWTYSCNHCLDTLLYQAKGYAETCPNCSEINVLTTCLGCIETWVLSRYGDWTCSSCYRSHPAGSPTHVLQREWEAVVGGSMGPENPGPLTSVRS